jgi:hypothetical protein
MLENACAVEGCTTPNNKARDGVIQTNVAMTLGWIAATFKNVARFSVVLGVDADLRADWLRRVERLAPFPTATSKNATVFDECDDSGDFGGNERYPVVYYGHIHPAAQVTRLSSTPEMLTIARETVSQVNALNGWHPVNGLCMAWPAASVVSDNASQTMDMFDSALAATMLPNFAPQIGSGCLAEQAGAVQVRRHSMSHC